MTIFSTKQKMNESFREEEKYVQFYLFSFWKNGYLKTNVLKKNINIVKIMTNSLIKKETFTFFCLFPSERIFEVGNQKQI